MFGSPFRGSMDLLKGDPNKQILLWVLFILISIHGIYGSPFRGSMDLLKGDPNKQIPKSWYVYTHSYFSGSVYLDLHSGDSWIYIKEIQILRTLEVNMFLIILISWFCLFWIYILGIHGSLQRVLFFGISIQGMHGSKQKRSK